jgi:hypothetical protein
VVMNARSNKLLLSVDKDPESRQKARALTACNINIPVDSLGVPEVVSIVFVGKEIYIFGDVDGMIFNLRVLSLA